MKYLILLLISITSFSYSGIQIKTEDYSGEEEYTVTQTSGHDAYIFDSENADFKSACYLGTSKDAVKTLESIMANTGIEFDKKGKIIPLADEDGYELPASAKIQVKKSIVYFDLDYQYPDQIGHDYSLKLSKCKSDEDFENYVGTYVLKGNSDVKLAITKKRVRAATLFEPAQYSFFINTISADDYNPMPYFDNKKLKKSQKGSFRTTFEEECDDPGCTYISDGEIFVTTSKKGNEYLVLDYYANTHNEETDEWEDSAERKVFFKLD